MLGGYCFLSPCGKHRSSKREFFLHHPKPRQGCALPYVLRTCFPSCPHRGDLHITKNHHRTASAGFSLLLLLWCFDGISPICFSKSTHQRHNGLDGRPDRQFHWYSSRFTPDSDFHLSTEEWEIAP